MQRRVTCFLNSVHKLINTNGKTVVQKHKGLKQPTEQYIMKELVKSLRHINNENAFCP
jgi:hypothetical protein